MTRTTDKIERHYLISNTLKSKNKNYDTIWILSYLIVAILSMFTNLIVIKVVKVYFIFFVVLL